MRIAIYTAIFGKKDILRTPINYTARENIDYFLITDNDKFVNEVYTVILKEAVYQDITKNARFYKIIGLEEFETYDYVIWHDANLQLKSNCILDLVDLVKNKQLATFKHPIRSNFYDEAIACINDKKEEPLILLVQCFIYFCKSYSPLNDLFETSIFVRNMKFRDSVFEKEWWNNVRRFSRRDQISLPIVIAKNNITFNVLEGHRMNSPYAKFNNHLYGKYYTKRNVIVLPYLIRRFIIRFIGWLKFISFRIHFK